MHEVVTLYITRFRSFFG